MLVSRSAGDPRCRCLIAVGGDGTVAALLNEQPGVPLTVFPAGTENLVAQHFGLRKDPDELARTIADANARSRRRRSGRRDAGSCSWSASASTATS